MANTTTIPNDKYLLVSDSNEVGDQYDSKKLRQDELANLAQENLFKKYLGIMSNYLTISQFNAYRSILNEKYNIQNSLFNQIKHLPWENKFKPVDGQVILLQVQQTDNEINRIYYSELAKLPASASQSDRDRVKKLSPLEYLRLHWDITSDYSVEQIYDCMLRGVTQIDPANGDKTKRDGNLKVGLTDDNMPIHMHNSGVTTGGSISCMHENNGENVGYIQGETVYDMFYNDSFSTGVDFNEFQGTVDDFKVQDSGIAEQSSASDPMRLMHDNLPNYQKFYAFIVTKNSTDR